jgi:glutathione peroxidase-family protein
LLPHLRIPATRYHLFTTALLLSAVASKCTFTPQYKELEELYQKYKDRGFVVVGA